MGRFACMLTAAVLGPLAVAQPTFEALGFLPNGFSSEASGVSADGRTVIGCSQTIFNDWVSPHAFRWTREEGMVEVGSPDPAWDTYESYARAVNRDGSLIVGNRGPAISDATAFLVRVEDGDLRMLPSPARYSVPYGLSADGAVIVGMLSDLLSPRGARWVLSGEPDLPAAPAGLGPVSIVSGVSADGSTFVGSCGDGAQSRALRWSGSGAQALALPPGAASSGASAISADASVVVGGFRTFSGSNFACRWTSDGRCESLGLIPGHTGAAAAAVSGDGSVVVGTCTLGASSGETAFIWSAAQGMRSIADELRAAGVAIPGWRLHQATGVSGDGEVVVGWGFNAQDERHAWIVHLPRSACPADFNLDGGVDGADVEAFFMSWEAGDPRADVDRSGGVDGSDVQAFYIPWAAGGC